MTNCEEYTMSYKQNHHVAKLAPEITEIITKKIQCREILSKYLQQLVEKMAFGNGQ